MRIDQTGNESGAAHSRRRFVSMLAASVSVAAVLPAAAAAPATPRQNGKRDLVFHHLHTGEKLKAVYWDGGHYDTTALASIDRLLRDFRTGDIHPIERGLLDILHTVRSELGTHAPFQVIGGYRSPKTNSMLRARSNGVAKRSLHMEGRAIDVRIAGVSTAKLREAAADLRLGGVGYYRSSDFVHLDTGRPRVW